MGGLASGVDSTFLLQRELLLSKVNQTLGIIVHFSGLKPTLGSFPAVESMKNVLDSPVRDTVLDSWQSAFLRKQLN